MSFRPIYYICIACPTIERTLEMVDRYVEHGAQALQIDMPSRDPYAETEFVKGMMADTLAQNPSYDAYMDGIREIRRRHPNLELHVVVYHDVVESIGLEKFAAFGQEIHVASFMIPFNKPETAAYIEQSGLVDMKIVINEMPEHEIEIAKKAGKDGKPAIVAIRNRKPGEVDKPGYDTFAKKYAYLKERGVTAPMYSVFGISTKEALQAVKDTGAAGAIIGNALMRLWDDEEALWRLLADFQSLAE